MTLDLARIRSEYPALAEGFVHFDGAGGTQPAAPVIDAIAAAMRTAVSNRGTSHEPARRSGEIVAAARAAVADLVGGDPAGVVFGPSATALTYLVARTLSRSWGPGDEVVVSRLDHDANVRPWVQAAEAAGATVRWADIDLATGELPVAQYADLVGPRTRLVAVTAASNAIGTVPAVRDIADVAHANGAQVYVDGVHATAHRPTDVAALGADYYVTSAYKWSGPHYAAVVADPVTWEPLHPVKLIPSPAAAPDRFEYGTLSFELLAGVTAAVDYLAGLASGAAAPAGVSAGDPVPVGGSVSAGGSVSVGASVPAGGGVPAPGDRRGRLLAGMAAAEAHENELAARLLTGLKSIDSVTLCPAGSDRCPTISFRLGDQAPAETARRLGEQGICVSHGDYYAVEYFEAAGLRATGGAVRASLYHYNTADEVDRLLAALK
ncbi:aminotransferase class V-fold PLP-dependent enzyme [Actinoplanes bogorensis]|uniref:Aminotransferase class V-fold PLP-dependent enzyme n=1 Tax=Paractinoplanes bogorensis TaxID=1610840 RepID=A0ABS5YN54_9ACTN|nr:aminotransferase class V-fold PLP-dependent enzyme [Actinoplanes bogorensis]MBU2664174.1 aminotransferase class V-fold PLP-dependent enzyme [Actinoplanes bogorensis]